MKEITLVVLRETLSHPHSPLFRALSSVPQILKKKLPASSMQVNATNRTYRPNKMLTTAEIGQITAAYRSGSSTYELAKTYGVGRHTIARQLKKAGVTMRVRNKR